MTVDRATAPRAYLSGFITLTKFHLARDMLLRGEAKRVSMETVSGARETDDTSVLGLPLGKDYALLTFERHRHPSLFRLFRANSELLANTWKAEEEEFNALPMGERKRLIRQHLLAKKRIAELHDQIFPPGAPVRLDLLNAHREELSSLNSRLIPGHLAILAETNSVAARFARGR